MSELLTCEVCGVGFQGRSDAVYCSSACRQKAHRGRTARRIAGMVAQPRPKERTRRAFAKPDVAGTIQRARHEQRRARELCRTAADTLRQSVASQQRLSASRRFVAQANAPAPPSSRPGVIGMISRGLG